MRVSIDLAVSCGPVQRPVAACVILVIRYVLSPIAGEQCALVAEFDFSSYADV